MVSQSTCILCKERSLVSLDLQMMRSVVDKYIGFVDYSVTLSVKVVERYVYKCPRGISCSIMHGYNTQLKFLVASLELVLSYLLDNCCFNELVSICNMLETILPTTVSIVREKVIVSSGYSEDDICSFYYKRDLKKLG